MIIKDKLCVRKVNCVVALILYTYLDSGAVCFLCRLVMCGASELVGLIILSLDAVSRRFNSS